MRWDLARSAFPVTDHWVFLDHAAVSPITAKARDAMQEWLLDNSNNGIGHVAKWVHRVEEVRAIAARMIQASASEIAFVKNTSEGIGWVAEGFPWKDGDNVVTAAEEYPSNVYPWMNLACKGVETRLVPSRDRRIHMDDLFAAVDARTRILALSHVEFASGLRNDLAAIGGLCRERGIYFLVDAIQGLGVFPIDVAALPIDFLSADSHKWLLGPEGAGIFYIRKDLIEMLRPVAVGWKSVIDCLNFSNIDFRLKTDAQRFESGALNVVGIVGMGASMEVLMELGIPAIAARVLELTDHLVDRALSRGFDIYSMREGDARSGIVSFTVPGQDSTRLQECCRDAKILVNVRGGRLRVSPHAYNSHEELNHLIDVLTM